MLKECMKRYLEKCRVIFSERQSESSKVTSFPGMEEMPRVGIRGDLEKTIKDAEDSEEFQAFAEALAAGPLALDLERLAEEVKRSEEGKSRDVNKYRDDTARQAAKSFFINTGTYLNLWRGSDVNESNLIDILEGYGEEKDSEIIRLFVFDGFVLYDDTRKLKNIRSPVGELRKYTEEELESLLRLPQSSWHYGVNPEIVKRAATWHILTVREEAEYGGMSGQGILGRFVSPIDWSRTEARERENYIGLIGPIFLCIGEDANLAEEMVVRTNVFEYSPVGQKVRNGYLPLDSFDEDGEPKPRTYINRVGENGKKLIRVFEMWQKVDGLKGEHYLRYPTEAYLRSVMSLHNCEMSIYNSDESLMQTFVSFVTVIESLLTPEGNQELAYKTAIRGAALLATDLKHRICLLEILDEFYKTRSKIVHKGHTGKEDSLDISCSDLAEISRQIFLRYICLLSPGLDGEPLRGILPDWKKKVSSKGSRPNAIAGILDALVLEPKLTEQLEETMEQWGVHEDWVRGTTFRITGKLPYV